MRKINLAYPDFIGGFPVIWFWENIEEKLGYPNGFWSPRNRDIYNQIKNHNGTNIEQLDWTEYFEGRYDCLDFEEDSKRLFSVKKVDDFIKAKESFFIPICITGSNPEQDLRYLEKSFFSQEIVEYLQAKKAAVLIFDMLEGNMTKPKLDRVKTFVKNNNLSKDEVVLVTSCINLQDEESFTLVPFSFFEHNLWFLWNKYKNLGKDVSKYTLQEEFKNDREKYLQENRTLPKQKHFLCLNRRVQSNRTYLAGFLRSSEDLESKSYISLGTGGFYQEGCEFTGQVALDVISEFLHFQGPVGDRVKKFYGVQHKNDIVLQTLDTDPEDLDILDNKAFDLNERLYRTSFLNIITETYYFDEEFSGNCHFFTEKTYKTIYSMQPFILVGKVGTLNTLRRQGFKTFSRWWDEGYDDVQDDTERLNRVCRIVESLSKKTIQEMFNMTQEMESVLVHNAELLASTQKLDQFVQTLVGVQDRGSIVKII